MTDWHLYDSIYTERYMGTPQEDPEAYERTSSVKAAKDHSGRMLLIYGTHDDNVHPQNTLKMIAELEQAGKHFDMRLYPGQRHGVRGQTLSVNLYEMMTGFLHRTLLETVPQPAEREETTWLGG